MDHKQIIQSYREEINSLSLKLSQLEVNFVEQRASDAVRQWQQTFDASSSSEMQRVLNETEKRKQAKVSSLANELRASLDQFKETISIRLAELDKFIAKINPDDEIELDYVKFELDSIIKKMDSLHFDILVEVVDTSKHRRLSTSLARNHLDVTKVFEFRNPDSVVETSTSLLDPLKNFVRRASAAGASYYNVGAIEPPQYF